jgi:hypothetical protein
VALSSTTSPRSVADKSDKPALLAAIRMALDIESSAVRHNTQTFNRGRYEATAVIPNYDALKDQARAIKEAAIARLPELLPKLETSVKRNGGHFFLARDGGQASRYITQLCRDRQVRLVVKGKSMTAEEVHLNRHLEEAGIEVAETDDWCRHSGQDCDQTGGTPFVLLLQSREQVVIRARRVENVYAGIWRQAPCLRP